MKNIFKRFSLVPKGMRYKLMIAFALMSVIPLLVCGYLVTTIVFPHVENLTQVSIIILLSILIAVMGFNLAKRLIDPVIDMAIETRIIASGDYARKISANREDEIGELGNSINLIAGKIRNYMTELQDYSIKTKEVNIEIQKKVLMLSDLLHISDMITASEKLDDVIEAVVSKVSDIEDGTTTALFLAESGSMDLIPRSSHNIAEKELLNLKFRLGSGPLGRTIKDKTAIRVDASAKLSALAGGARRAFERKNCLILPVVSRGKAVGFLFAGNNKENYNFAEDIVELVKVMTKQLGIAIENDTLLRKTEELTVKDELTDLYNEKYIKERLDEEIKRAMLFQRPCSLILLNIDNFKSFRQAHGEMNTEKTLRKISVVLKDSATEISKVARIGGDEFAIVLPEKNKKEAVKLAEEIRVKVEETELTISGGVSENPLDGVTGVELFDKALGAMKIAKQSGKNKIETHRGK